MNWKTLIRRLLLLTGLSLTACTEETPTDVGDDLLPSGAVRTFEVILEPGDFIEYDTTFTGYTRAQDAPFGLIANRFEGVLDANLLIRMAQPLRVINVRNAAGTIVPDSNPNYFAGRLVVRIDTLRTDSDPPVRFSAFRTAEEWDFSATWTLRVDTGNVRRTWATPGGTRGPLVDTASWTAGDSLIFDLDSATIAEWRDTANLARGAIVVAETNGARVRVSSAAFRLQARSSLRPDTILDFDVAASMSVFIYNPEAPPATGQLRVGGVTSWRSIIRLRSDLRNMTFPCPDTPGCQIRLDQAHINIAQLLLQPAAAPPGFVPEDSSLMHARTLLVASSVPLQRSPIGQLICPAVLLRCGALLRADWFAQPPSPERVTVDLTSYIAPLVAADTEVDDRPSSTITLLSSAEPFTFGFAAFEPGPRLRLVLTAAVERPQ